MDTNEAQAILHGYKQEFEAAREVVAALAAQMMKDAAEYRAQMEMAQAKMVDLSQRLPQMLRTTVEDAIRLDMSGVAGRLTAAVTVDAEASAGHAKQAVLQLATNAADAVQTVVAARWKMLMVLWGSPLLLMLLSIGLVAQNYRNSQGELHEVKMRQAVAQAQYDSLRSMSGGMFFNTSDKQHPFLFVPSGLPLRSCTLVNGASGSCVSAASAHASR